MANGRSVIMGGLAIGAAALGWWLLGRRSRTEAAPAINQAQAAAFALSWAEEHASVNGLTLLAQTRIRFFVGKPPRMSMSSWVAVGGVSTSAFYYVEFSFSGGNFLTVMINAVTGEKPPVSEGWVAGTMTRNFGL